MPEIAHEAGEIFSIGFPPSRAYQQEQYQWEQYQWEQYQWEQYQKEQFQWEQFQKKSNFKAEVGRSTFLMINGGNAPENPKGSNTCWTAGFRRK